VLPFPEPAPDHPPTDEKPVVAGNAPVRIAGRVDLTQLTRGVWVALGAILIVGIGSFLPWYSAHADLHATSPCPPVLHGTDMQTCLDENRAEQGQYSIPGFYWNAWDTPLAWISVLAILGLGVLLLRRAMPSKPPVHDLLVLFATVVADLLFLLAFARMPSPGNDVSGSAVPGSDAWIPGWGLWTVLVAVLALNIGIGLDLVRRDTASKNRSISTRSGVDRSSG
jgi:hypothetical protein